MDAQRSDRPDRPQALGRRHVLQRLALGGAAAATLPSWVETLSALAEDHAAHAQRPRASGAVAWKPKVFTPQQNETVIAISELIIPQTETPGAKAARVNEFIDFVLWQAPQQERELFLTGLAALEARTQQDYGQRFTACTPDQHHTLFTRLSALASQPGAESGATSAKSTVPPADAAAVDFFQAVKSMTITGYYTSEVGVRQELGDDGTLFFAEFKGCTHPEHQG